MTAMHLIAVMHWIPTCQVQSITEDKNRNEDWYAAPEFSMSDQKDGF